MKAKFAHGVLSLVLAIGTAVSALQAQLAEFYVGIDGRSVPFNAPVGDGGGAYPDNPNEGRLTFLYNHGDHYHGLGTYRYTGPAATPVLEDTSANNRVPEGYTMQEPLTLLPGSGVYAGRNTTGAQPGVNYSDLEMRNVHSLSGVDNILYNSSSMRWNGAFDEADVHLKLLSVSSPELNVGSPADPFALSVGGDVHLGEGDEMFSFTPVLWVDQAAPAGHYWAEFQLIDVSGNYGNSGRFFIDVQQIPEPGSMALLVLVGLMHNRRLTRKNR